MKKILTINNIFLVTLVFSFLGCITVYATDTGANCEGLLGPDLIEFLNEIFKYLKIIGMVLAIALGFLDFGKAVINKENDELSKAKTTFIKRLVAAVLIFFLPYILNFILELVDGMGKSCVGTGGTV